MKNHLKRICSAAILTILAACGGGDTSETSKAPDLVVFFISGHTDLDGQPSYSYLHITAGPSIVADLINAGYSVEPHYYVDDAFPVGGMPGFQDLVKDMRTARDQNVPKGSRVVVIAHSHGGVWAHAAIRAVSNLTVTAQVDLDTSSFGWAFVHHDLQNSYIGGDPRDEFTVNNLTACPQYANIPSETSFSYDIEDVIFGNVKNALEIRSGEMPPFASENYDEKWNIRDNGTQDGLSCYYSGTSHNEVHQPGGTTIPIVKNWLISKLKA